LLKILRLEIIVDSGSSKADWLVTKNFSFITKIRTIGFNPFFHSADFISTEIKKQFLNLINPNEINKIIYYGAGCSSDERNLLISNGISQFFTNAEIEIYHDILAAARATCMNDPGIACILGTGSNSCLYNGVEIIDNLPSLGYLLGDEGSGSSFGKILIKKLFYRELSEELLYKFNLKYGFSKEDILDRLYNHPHVNVFLAKFSEFFSENKENKQVEEMVKECFREFFKCHVTKYKGYKDIPVHFVGSIGFIFSNILIEVAGEFQVKLGKVIRTPIEYLVEYHQHQIAIK